ncbi:CHC2 zinc finger domain-containing protein [Spirosoma endophyticum]|uniref:Toprim-like n=1 Tax=Spirosoma endophyticum TaxID=662367 RepID=A0A1I1UH63_9BACT|nr:CHC2 zinc finger domain-containing protein [Spirosoma endophyticum]SFD67270.1 Toprim-like [Spirosoma endophyticum]
MENALVLRAKEVSIPAYLYSRNIIPAEHSRSAINDYAYFSPFSNERTPSFFVNSHKNVFTDYSSGEKGDAIRLVLLLEKCSFIEAVERLLSIDNVLPDSLVEKPTNETNEADRGKHIITDVTELRHYALTQYVESRGIPIHLARRWVKQIHYSLNDRNYFGVGFESDKGSWAVRSNKFQCNIGGTGIRTIPRPGNKVYLFEGFFDFLSALVHYGVIQPSHTTIVLNSTTNLNDQLIKQWVVDGKVVFTFLDNDDTGKKAVIKLRNAGCTVTDCSGLYAEYNDFNDLIKARI